MMRKIITLSWMHDIVNIFRSTREGTLLNDIVDPYNVVNSVINTSVIEDGKDWNHELTLDLLGEKTELSDYLWNICDIIADHASLTLNEQGYHIESVSMIRWINTIDGMFIDETGGV